MKMWREPGVKGVLAYEVNTIHWISELFYPSAGCFFVLVRYLFCDVYLWTIKRISKSWVLVSNDSSSFGSNTS